LQFPVNERLLLAVDRLKAALPLSAKGSQIQPVCSAPIAVVLRRLAVARMQTFAPVQRKLPR
jgi:hypothetical protein